MRPILENTTDAYSVTAYGKGQIELGARLVNETCIVFPDAIHFPALPSEPTDLVVEHFSILLDKKPEVIIVGTGVTQLFVSGATLAECNKQMIGVECMDTAAACRCFNILLAEGRYVVALLYMI